ncbi:MAG: putative baseplate assembly protein [Acidobacteriota bacterium]|nr:putative baseplate assembly protein [Acidobacteriota bacterium]
MSATCGCCAGIHVETPKTIANRPNLSAIAYRAGDWASFKRSMLAALTKTRLTTRDDDDFSIALLDAWATASDVLTFYQERIANESYLGTAGERESILRLARLVGYELDPGIAAETPLAFFVDEADGAPKKVLIEKGSKVQSVPDQDEEPRTFETLEPLEARVEWNELRPRLTVWHAPAAGDDDIYVGGTATRLRAGDALLFRGASDSEMAIRRVTTVHEDFDAKRTRIAFAPELPENVFTTAPEVFAMRIVAPLFGSNAADPRTLDSKITAKYGVNGNDWAYTISNNTINIEGAHPEIAAGSRLVLANESKTQLLNIAIASVVTIADYAMIGKATKVITKEVPDDAFAGTGYRATSAYAAPELLALAERPTSAFTLTLPIELDRRVPWVEGEKRVLITGRGPFGGARRSEVVTVDSVDDSDSAHTKLVIKKLAKGYGLASVRIYANVVDATDGETVREILGSGDAATPFQSFVLSHKPLTYIHAPGGTASTLEMRVNDILWHEVETLYGQGPHARVFATRHADDGSVTVQFGDGVESGARLPTGHDNVRAVYRKGIGANGNLAPDKLTLLLTRPLGLRGATNPRPASGGANPQLMKDARRNAPRTVTTLDRVVSLTDYQAHAISFPGVAKAIATWTMTGGVRQVFLSVAGANGLELASDSNTITSLRSSLLSRGDPYVPLRIASFNRTDFVVKARIGVHRDSLSELVLPRVKSAVLEAFSFDARDFGQAVDLSDLMSAMHAVEGVAFVDIDHLYRLGDPPARNERLVAALPMQHSDGTITPAEVLVLKTVNLEVAQ